MNLSEHIIFVLFLMQYSNIALLKMKYKVEADILTDDWPNFKCTVIKVTGYPLNNFVGAKS